MNLLNGIMDFVKFYLQDEDLTPKQVVEIANNILQDKEFRETLEICVKYYRGKQKRENISKGGRK